MAMFLMTHACSTDLGPKTIIRGDKGELHLSRTAAEFHFNDGRNGTITRVVDLARSAEVAVDHWIGRNTSAPLAWLATISSAVSFSNDRTGRQEIDSLFRSRAYS